MLNFKIPIWSGLQILMRITESILTMIRLALYKNQFLSINHIIIVTVVIKFDSGKLKQKLHPCSNFKEKKNKKDKKKEQHAGIIWNIFQNWKSKVEFWIKYKPNQTKTKKTTHKKNYNFISFVTLQSLHPRGVLKIFFWGGMDVWLEILTTTR